MVFDFFVGVGKRRRGEFWCRGVGIRGYGEEGVCFLWVDWVGECVECVGCGVGWGRVGEGVG